MQNQHTLSRCRQGSVTPWLLLGLLAIVGIIALGMDGGRMFEERRHVQAAADAAALSAAVQNYNDYFHGGSNTQSAALSSAAENGYANDGVNSIVTVNSPPTSGAFAGKANCFEVIVQSNLPATFGAIFTGKPLTATARAVARGRPRNIGVMALNQSGAGAFTNKGIGAFVILNAPIYVNSNDPVAFTQAGLGPITASYVNISGGYANTSGGLILSRVNTGVAPVADPLALYPIPNVASYPTRSSSHLKINSLLPTILQPGVYVGGISVSGASVVTMLPGIYIMDGGGFQISGLATLAAVEVMIFNTSVTTPAGPVTFNTTGVVAIVPPLSGTYQGFSIFQDRASTQPVSLTGFGVTSILGTIYAPSAPLALTGLAGVGVDTLGGAYIAGSITVGGVGNININLGPHQVRVPDVTLLE
jgi:putative Flp pilus-assembly TadE/G-like protein